MVTLVSELIFPKFPGCQPCCNHRALALIEVAAMEIHRNHEGFRAALAAPFDRPRGDAERFAGPRAVAAIED